MNIEMCFALCTDNINKLKSQQSNCRQVFATITNLLVCKIIIPAAAKVALKETHSQPS